MGICSGIELLANYKNWAGAPLNNPEEPMSQTHTIEGFVSGLVKQFTARPSTIAGEVSRLGAARRQTLAILANVTDEEAQWSPRLEAWSVVQVVDHIVLFEGLYRDSISKLIELHKQGRKTEIKYSLADIDVSIPGVPRAAWDLLEIPLDCVNAFVPAAVRQTFIRFPVVAATSPKIANPRPGLTLAGVREELAVSARATNELFAQPLPDDGQNMKLSHPVLGINNVADLLGMMAAHEERHQKQIRELLSHTSRPRA